MEVNYSHKHLLKDAHAWLYELSLILTRGGRYYLNVFTYAQDCIHTYIHTYTHAHICKNLASKRTHVRTHNTYIHIYTYYVRAYTHAYIGARVGTTFGIISDVSRIENERGGDEETIRSRTLHSDVHKRIICTRNHKNKYKLIIISHFCKIWEKYYSIISELNVTLSRFILSCTENPKDHWIERQISTRVMGKYLTTLTGLVFLIIDYWLLRIL